MSIKKESKDKKDILTQQEKKAEYIIDIAKTNLGLQKEIFSSLDQKSIWAITFMTALLWLVIDKFYLEMNWLLLFSCSIWLIAIIVNIWNLSTKWFKTWVNTTSLSNQFWKPNDNLYLLKNSVLWNLNQSNQDNINISDNKAKLFNISLLLIILSMFWISLFLIFNKMTDNEQIVDLATTWDENINVQQCSESWHETKIIQSNEDSKKFNDK